MEDFAPGEEEIAREIGRWGLGEMGRGFTKTGVVGGGGNEDGVMNDIGEIPGTARSERRLENARETEFGAGFHWRDERTEKKEKFLQSEKCMRNQK